MKTLPETKKKIDRFCHRLTKLAPFVKITLHQEKGQIIKISFEGCILTTEINKEEE